MTALKPFLYFRKNITPNLLQIRNTAEKTRSDSLATQNHIKFLF